jgi:hypothetical protein
MNLADMENIGVRSIRSMSNFVSIYYRTRHSVISSLIGSRDLEFPVPVDVGECRY